MKVKFTYSPEPIYFTQFAMRYPVDGRFGGGVDAGLFLEHASILKKWFLMFAFFLTESLLTPAEA
jgi:hypothetical protein